jgi:hypothetical protein
MEVLCSSCFILSNRFVFIPLRIEEKGEGPTIDVSFDQLGRTSSGLRQYWIMIYFNAKGMPNHWSSSITGTSIHIPGNLRQLMSEVIIGHVLGMYVMDAYVHVQTGLNVVLGHTAILQRTHCLPSTED